MTNRPSHHSEDIPGHLLAWHTQGYDSAGAFWSQPRPFQPALRITLGPGAIAPTYGSDGAAGLDLYVPSNLGAATRVDPGEREFIDTRVSLAIPAGYWGHVLGRSGLARKSGVVILGGVIDCDYRGSIGIVLLNSGDEPLVIEPGMRLAQIVIAPCAKVAVAVVDSLDETVRGAAGFGSTGMGAR